MSFSQVVSHNGLRLRCVFKMILRAKVMSVIESLVTYFLTPTDVDDENFI